MKFLLTLYQETKQSFWSEAVGRDREVSKLFVTKYQAPAIGDLLEAEKKNIYKYL